MITIHYFASLRERFQCEEEKIPWDKSLATVEQLKTFLSQRGDEWRSAMTNPSTQAAINHQVATNDSIIKKDDEVAFFPPVTGG
jgi:molybdopterin synthase sulfur carrier subunit